MVDVLFVAHKRSEFIRESLKALLASFSDPMERRIYVYSDGADCDTAREVLSKHGGYCLDSKRYGGPVACTIKHLDMLQNGKTNLDIDPPDFLAKIDNDVIVPPGWLPACLDLMRRYPNIDLLGIEPWTPDRKLFPRWVEPLMPVPENHWKFQPRPVSHIGGIGVFRRSAFERFGRPVPNSQDGRYGFTEWQWAHPRMVKAFIAPPLPVFLLDHIDFEPWFSLGSRYVWEGIQRDVGWMYNGTHRRLWDWWLASGEKVTRGDRGVGGPR